MTSTLIRIVFSLFLLFLFIPNSLQAATGQRIALVIGNSNYKAAPLRNPVNDATDMARSLKNLGFKVILKTNVAKRDMGKAVDDFGKRLKGGDVGLFYYAGHGVQVNGVNYLIPVGAIINEETDVEYEGIDAGRILATMYNAKSRINIVILDACRDNPYVRSFRSLTRGLAIISKAPAGTIIAYSTSPGDVAIDGKGRNSPYTSSLLKYMKEPGLTIEDVFKGVRQKLRKETGQVPWELSSLEWKFYFIPPSAAARESSEPLISQGRETTEVAMANRPPTSEESSTFTSPTIGAKFVLITPPAGTFLMGGSGYDETKHHVAISNPFYIQTTEVTQGQWEKVMGKNLSNFSTCGDGCPVERVSWNNIQEFIRKLNDMEGTDKYRLPTEAEW
ncbi:MAG TPA: hypothetical protein DD713_08460, partial [Nitrospiraceae bacterium]|nr:hypothetical protein [Nitrospiraceae bacterium]